MYHKRFYFLFLVLIPSILSAGMFKCIDNRGKVTFQATPCKANSQQATLKYSSKKASQASQCVPKCRSEYMICLGNQGNSKDRDDGIDLCKKSKKACEVNCTDPKKGEELIQQAEYERKRFEFDKRDEKRRKAYERKQAQARKDIKHNIRNYTCRWYKDQLADAQQAWKEKKRDGYTPHDKRKYQKWIKRAQKDVNAACQ